MPIFPYRERDLVPEASAALSEINQYSLSAKAMLTALGDYWTNYYRTLEPVAAASTGAVTSLSKEYTRILDMVRSANILDVPLRQSEQFRLLVIRRADVEPVYDAAGNLDHYFIPLADVTDARYLTTSLFESRVVLEKGVHFDIDQGKGFSLYVDLFGDAGITGYTYEIGEDSDQGILLWANDIAFTSSVIYERFGRFLYRKAPDGEQYKWLVTALMRFYESAKSVESIQNVLNIMYGVPYTRYKDEVVQAIYYVDQNLNRVLSQIEDPYICIETDKACYYTYAFSEVLYKVGDTVPQFSLLANFNKVEDYISKPKWWEDVAFPDALVQGSAQLSAERKNELMDKVLKYNTVHINLGVSFETYQTYLAQVKQFFEIIESGFPVYLYPLVDTFFRAVFLDKWDISDELLKLRLAMGMESEYPWGTNLKFNGEVPYYMEPDKNHGKDSHCRERLFNGDESYSPPARHQCENTNILHFDGTAYDSSWRRDHGNDREKLLITRVGVRQAEAWPWDTSPNLRKHPLAYSGERNADGACVFGQDLTVYDNEVFLIKNRREFADAMPKTGESEMAITARPAPFADAWADPLFDGAQPYRGTGQAKTPCDSLKIKMAKNFADRIRARDSFDIALVRDFAEKIETGEELSALGLGFHFGESFAGNGRFDGGLAYSGKALPRGSLREEFTFRILRA